MNLKVPGTILPLGCAILSTRAKPVGGLVQPPLRRTRVKYRLVLWCVSFFFILIKNMLNLILFPHVSEAVRQWIYRVIYVNRNKCANNSVSNFWIIASLIFHVVGEICVYIESNICQKALLVIVCH